MSAAQEVAALRDAAGLFRLPTRGVLEVGGSDRVRWLDGMVTNDVSTPAGAGPGAGCYALLLTPQGRVVADLHVLVREGCFWLETEGCAIPGVTEHLHRYVVADDVALVDRSSEFARLAVEGPAAARILEIVLHGAHAPEPDGWRPAVLDGVELAIAGFALAGGPAFQVFAPRSSEGRVHAALLRVGKPEGLTVVGTEALDVLRVEAGIPWLGRDLDPSVLPDEARLERAISTAKGCYTGQEVVARMRSRGRIRHRLVGLRSERNQPFEVGAALVAGGQRVGEVTSCAVSPTYGAIALGFVRCPHDAPGTRLEARGTPARVVALPFAGSG